MIGIIAMVITRVIELVAMGANNAIHPSMEMNKTYPILVQMIKNLFMWPNMQHKLIQSLLVTIMEDQNNLARVSVIEIRRKEDKKISLMMITFFQPIQRQIWCKF